MAGKWERRGRYKRREGNTKGQKKKAPVKQGETETALLQRIVQVLNSPKYNPRRGSMWHDDLRIILEKVALHRSTS